MRRRVLAAVAVVALFGGAGAACQKDDPDTELPCEFYEQQKKTGAVETVPEDCR